MVCRRGHQPNRPSLLPLVKHSKLCIYCQNYFGFIALCIGSRDSAMWMSFRIEIERNDEFSLIGGQFIDECSAVWHGYY